MRELQGVIEELADQLHRAVAIDDPAIRLLAHTAHDEPVDEHRVHSIMTLRAGLEVADYVFSLGIRTATQPVHIPGRPDLKMLGRVCFPVRCQGLHLGYLWLIDDDATLTEDDMAASAAAAGIAGEILFRSRLLDDLRRARERQLVLDLISPDSGEEPSVGQADLDAVGITESLGCRMVVVYAPFAEHDLDTEAGELGMEAVLRRGVQRLKRVRPLLATRRGGRAYLLIAFRAYEDPLEQLRVVAAEMREELVQSLPGSPGVLIGIGPAVPDVASARVSHLRAQGAIDVCRAVNDFGHVAAWDDLGIYRVLQQLPLGELADVAIPVGLRNLLEAESDQWLIETLDTYLDSAGNVQESAKRLHVHRATLYYRLSRIEELTGMSLAQGQDRLALHLGVKLARLTGAFKGPVLPAADREEPGAEVSARS